ncbi:Lipopolysaccharide-assembly, LptC-related [Abditibacterium utsteinense]|uniref:Lipopolysaccharide-assembly, LptC-related n=1 Tax=Abditibacterium utsteinense TaxID=1960156 RepID=A0A2S8SX32_9BACT|nr:LptA/OstA family protein [Abditibacterium utsteinense]PQV65328.1 Lipopolysaccharide-assembly, LptC-related [Abditibacterium utsteinense]
MTPLPSRPASSSARGATPSIFGLGAAPRARLKRFLLLAAGLGAGAWLWGWLSVDESGQPVAQSSDEPSLEIEGLQSLMVRRDGLPFWEFSARRVTTDSSGTSTLATGGGHAQLFRQGQPFLKVSAPRVRFSNLSSNLEASGGVSALGPDGFSFQTARALWRNAEKTVDCPQAVTARLRGLYFQTPRLSYLWDKGVLRCPQSVEVRGQGVVLRGKKLEAILKPRIVKLSEGVEMVFDPRSTQVALPGMIQTAADKNGPRDSSNVSNAMKIRPSLPLGVCLTTSALFAAVYAQGAKKPAPKAAAKVPAAPSTIQNGNVRLNGENGDFNDATGIGHLTKNVTVTQVGEDFILYAQDLLYNRKENRAIATGNLRVDTADSTIRGARIDADFDTKTIIITGNVTITTHGKKDGIIGNREDLRAKLQQKPARILCERADWDYEERQATITGNVRMTQEENSGTCERILYDEPQHVAQLIGRVRFVDKNGRIFNTPNLTIYINQSRIVAKNPRMGFNRPSNAVSQPQAPKVPVLKVQPPPQISNEDLKQFDVKPPPLPTPRPEPTEIPTPAPAEPDTAPESESAASEPAA